MSFNAATIDRFFEPYAAEAYLIERGEDYSKLVNQLQWACTVVSKSRPCLHTKLYDMSVAWEPTIDNVNVRSYSRRDFNTLLDKHVSEEDFTFEQFCACVLAAYW